MATLPTPSPFAGSTRHFAPRLRSLLPTASSASAIPSQNPDPSCGAGEQPPLPHVSLEIAGARRGILAGFDSLRRPYHAFPIVTSNRHVETIFAAFARSLPTVALRRECLRTPDDGSVALDWVLGDCRALPRDAPVLILLPGLTGGSDDTYVRHMLMRARSKGWRVVVFNSRGCADSPVTTAKFYSASFTGDLCQVVDHVLGRYPQSNVYAVGWSLGANILVRYLGEETDTCPLSGAVSLCNPFNLVIADEDFHKGFNNVYDGALARALRTIFKKHALLFEGLDGKYDIPKAANARTVRDFDEGLTRVSFGFKSVDDYYSNSCSSDSIKNVSIPLLCIQADNDPIAPSRGIPREDIKRNEVHKDDFLRVIRNIVGDQMLKQAAHKVFAQMQAQAQRNNQANANQCSLLSQASTQQNPFSGSAQLHDQQVRMPTPPNLGQKSQASSSPQAFVPLSGTQVQNNMHYFAHDNSIQKTDAKGMHATPNRPPSMSSAISLQAMNKQQQPTQVQQTSQQTYGTINPPAQSYPRPISGSTPLRSLGSESETRPSLHPHGMVHAKIGTAPTHPTVQHNAAAQQMQQNKDLKTSAFNPGANTKQDSESAGKARLVGTGGSSAKLHGKQAPPNTSTPPAARTKKSGGQKKSLETAGSTPPPSSKKQKTSGAFQEQSIDQLNDVTAVSGVNLREEEEQLLSTPKEESHASEAARRIVQEEEEKLFLQKGPLLKKLAGIILKCNLKNISGDVERCLSMCVEERLRRFISTLIRISKQRIDSEKTGHRLVITSDVGRQILRMNQKAKEEWDKKHAEETDKNKKQTEVDGSGGADMDKEKEESRPKNAKPNKEEDDKMRTTAANVAARQAVGGSDMLSKWQLMAEQARQKREGIDVGSASQRAPVPRPSHILGKGPMENQEASKRTHSAAFGTGGMNKQGRGPFAVPHSNGPQRTISVKDVICVLEREPQMTKSQLIYELYGRLPADSNTD